MERPLENNSHVFQRPSSMRPAGSCLKERFNLLHKSIVLLLTMMITPVFFSPVLAKVEWNIQRTLNLDAPPLDVAVSLNGKRIYVLTDQGTILIYSPDGNLKEKIQIGNHVDQIQVGPREDIILLKSKKKKTVQVLSIDFIKQINVSGSPFKGSVNAPVVIAVFSEFQ